MIDGTEGDLVGASKRPILGDGLAPHRSQLPKIAHEDNSERSIPLGLLDAGHDEVKLEGAVTYLKQAV
jgi:hypothetical protein